MLRTYGWKKDSPDPRDLHLAVAQKVPLPPSADLRAGMPSIYDQSSLGSCTANAIAAAVDFERKKQSLSFLNPSRLGIYYGERAMEGTIGQDAGAMIRDGIKITVSQGVGPESLWPYDILKFTEKPPVAYYAVALKHQTLQYSRVTQSPYYTKHCLEILGRPFVAGIAVYDSFESESVARAGNVPLPDPAKEQLLGGHAILICGYDDTEQRYIFRNSWGSTWGSSGYGFLPYGYLLNPSMGSDFWVVLTTEANQ